MKQQTPTIPYTEKEVDKLLHRTKNIRTKEIREWFVRYLKAYESYDDKMIKEALEEFDERFLK